MSHLLDKSFLHVEASGPVPALIYKIKHLLSYDSQWYKDLFLGDENILSLDSGDGYTTL